MLAYKRKVRLRLFVASLTLVAVSWPVFSQAAFNPSHIISDYEFRDYESMNLDDVFRFLQSKGSSLTAYVDPQIRVSSAQLIYDHAQLSQINPKVLLVTLQKEQSLITDAYPSPDQYDWATGYGICDSCSKSSPTVQKYRGFANQIDYAASALRLFHDNPQAYGYTVGSIQTIDGQAVPISNSATHALYLYTPHLHGNQNFYNIWQDWFAQDYPDGSLLQDAESGGVYIIQHGAKRPFESKIALVSRYSLDKVIKVSPENLDSYSLGPPIKFAQYALLQDKTSGGVYLIADDKKRPIISREVFKKIGFNPEEIVPVSPEELSTVATGEPITLSDAYPTGALLQDKTSGGVWFIQNGTRQPVWSKELMLVNYPQLKPRAVAAQEIEQFALGEPVRFKDGELVRSKEFSTVYVISNTLKRPLVSGEIFEKLGYKWENVIVTSEKGLSVHLEGEPVTVEL